MLNWVLNLGLNKRSKVCLKHSLTNQFNQEAAVALATGSASALATAFAFARWYSAARLASWDCKASNLLGKTKLLFVWNLPEISDWFGKKKSWENFTNMAMPSFSSMHLLAAPSFSGRISPRHCDVYMYIYEKMCICIHIYIYICVYMRDCDIANIKNNVLYISTCMWKSYLHLIFLYTHVCMTWLWGYILRFVYLYEVYIFLFIYLLYIKMHSSCIRYIYMYMYMSLCGLKDVHIYINTYTYLHIYIYTYIHIYIYTYIHIYICIYHISIQISACLFDGWRALCLWQQTWSQIRATWAWLSFSGELHEDVLNIQSKKTPYAREISQWEHNLDATGFKLRAWDCWWRPKKKAWVPGWQGNTTKSWKCFD